MDCQPRGAASFVLVLTFSTTFLPRETLTRLSAPDLKAARSLVAMVGRMTNVSSTPEKMATRRGLRSAAEEALRAKGYMVEHMTGAGKSSLRRITKGGASKVVTIRTTQDRWIAF